ncbi:helix-turn-helix domain-containing protein [Streptosporangium sp. G11]|uniref:helix-turn-helix domain-containing protein n=1 Tax=Streptosporangium sp. G11 TaxID=3436926 RepID=UPI003EB8D814
MVNGIENTSRSRRQRPLPDDLPEPTRVLLRELRALKERAGLDLRALEQATHASRSSWGRWLAGDTWIPLDAVEGLARLCREDENRFRELWEAAEQARRMAGIPEVGERPPEVSAETSPAERSGNGTPKEGEGPEEGAGLRDGEAAKAGEVSGGEKEPGGEKRSGDGKGSRDGKEADAPAARRPTSRPRRRFLIGTALGLSVGVAAGVMLSGSAFENGAGHGAGPAGSVLGSPAGGVTASAKPAVDRAGVIGRARSWRPATARRVPYSQFKTYGGYRTDGSGYVSMTLGLPRPGPNTISLASPNFSRRIKMTELLQGDLVIDPVGGNTARAVVIFDRWANAGRTSYWAYQQRSGYGTDHRVVEHGLKPGDQFRAHRPVNLRNDVPAPDTTAPD